MGVFVGVRVKVGMNVGVLVLVNVGVNVNDGVKVGVNVLVGVGLGEIIISSNFKIMPSTSPLFTRWYAFIVGKFVLDEIPTR